MNMYYCRFCINEIFHIVENKHFSNLKDGFWVDENLKYTSGSNAKYWIPPSKIEFISKNIDDNLYRDMIE